MLMTLLYILLAVLGVLVGLLVVLTLTVLLTAARISIVKKQDESILWLRFQFGLLKVDVKASLTELRIVVRVSVGPLHMTKTFGRRKKAKKKPPAEKKPKEQPEKKEKKDEKPSEPRFNFRSLTLEQVLDLVFKLMDDLTGSITFERLYVTVILHTNDAAKTAELLGGASAVTGLLYPELERHFVLKDPKIVLDADFDAEKTVWAFDIRMMTRLVRYPAMLIRRRKELLGVWKTIRKK